MADGGERNSVDFYKILGLEKECSPTDLKNAYKKLAKRWHPDRCSASGNSKFVEEANKKFQAIQEAYSVLSDETKRFLYDVGVYDNDDDENNNGMGDFLNEMVTMMSEHKPCENGEESFEQLQELFEDMFQRDSCDAFASTSSQGMNSSGSSSYGSSIEGSCINNKRNSVGMNRTDASSSFNDINFESFCLGMDCRGDSRRIKGTIARTQGGGGSNCSSNRDNSRRRYGRKQKIAPGHDVSSNDYSGIST
ncbi:dnaJ homolog subfamily B member 6-like isoform X1 [Chenopodium quinoa]|uniref:J domain-containing protein n=1 Tax=Chenopodium quinoa TaxID=63459 RepID=A0A803KQX9_CHEQI|nr:dnaJ homolog subfamily B member 6-like isoform X1 [Chenopodium quinoa]